jgi:hypothetical protein
MKTKPKYRVDESDLTIRKGNCMPIAACTSLSGARKIAIALNAMEAKPKAEPSAFDWSGIPAKYKWAAMDADREWAAFVQKPISVSVAWNVSSNDDFEFENLGYNRPPYPGDWRDSLQKRP